MYTLPLAPRPTALQIDKVHAACYVTTGHALVSAKFKSLSGTRRSFTWYPT